MSKQLSIFAVLVLFVATPSDALIRTINFESIGNNLGEGAQVATASPGNTNVVASFSIQNGPGGTLLPIIAAPGGATLGFQNTDTPESDTPDQTSPLLPTGQFFLTNGHKNVLDSDPFGDYVIGFSEPVMNVSLLLYDYIFDGDDPNGTPPVPGQDAVTLVGSLNGSIVETFDFIIQPDLNDGFIIELALMGDTVVDEITVQLNGADFGTGIDQIRFMEAVPEPGTSSILVLGLCGMFALIRRR